MLIITLKFKNRKLDKNIINANTTNLSKKQLEKTQWSRLYKRDIRFTKKFDLYKHDELKNEFAKQKNALKCWKIDKWRDAMIKVEMIKWSNETIITWLNELISSKKNKKSDDLIIWSINWFLSHHIIVWFFMHERFDFKSHLFI